MLIDEHLGDFALLHGALVVDDAHGHRRSGGDRRVKRGGGRGGGPKVRKVVPRKG